MPTVTEKQPEATRRRGRYPKEFRRDAAALVIEQNRTVAGRFEPGQRRGRELLGDPQARARISRPLRHPC
jgi:hypothetical protein